MIRLVMITLIKIDAAFKRVGKGNDSTIFWQSQLN